MSNDIAERDYFTDPALLNDPYSYLAAIREKGRVYHDSKRGLVYITGYEEALEVLRDSENFSSVAAAAGIAPLPFEPQGDDVSEQIEEHRAEIMGSDLIAAYDGEKHTTLRAYVARIFSPTRLKANEDFMTKLAAKMTADLVDKSHAEVINELSTPYVTLVIADLLGVPEEEMEVFRSCIDDAPPPFDINAVAEGITPEPSSFFITMGTYFYNYVIDRRANPKDDVISELANAEFPDGSAPSDIEVVKTLMFLFGAGQDTTAKLLGNALRYLAEHQDMQQTLREDRSLIKPFIEEMLRREGSVKATFRMAKRNVTVGGVDIQAGKQVIIFLAGANRDPVRWDAPNTFNIKREQLIRHVAFGQGRHVCIGAQLARVEVRVILNALLEKTANFELSEEHHGSLNNRKIDYETSYVIRGLSNLHVNFTPA